MNDLIVKSDLSENWNKNLAVADQMVKTGFMPKALRTAQQVVLVMETGRELGLPPMEALRNIYIVDNKTALASQLMLSLIYRSDKLEDIKIEDKEKSCTVTMQRKGMSPYSVTFTESDARNANLLHKDNWKNYPKNMYRARAISMCARVVCSDIVAGLYTPDEIEDHLDTEEITAEVDRSKLLTQDDEYNEWFDSTMVKLRYEMSQVTEPEQVNQYRKSIAKDLASMLEADRLIANEELNAKYNELVTGNTPGGELTKITEYKEGADKCLTVPDLFSWFKGIQQQAIEDLSAEELKVLTTYCSQRKKLLEEVKIEPKVEPKVEPDFELKPKPIEEPAKEEGPLDPIVCSNVKCSQVILDPKVINYSMVTFKKVLCRVCQDQERMRNLKI